MSSLAQLEIEELLATPLLAALFPAMPSAAQLIEEIERFGTFKGCRLENGRSYCKVIRYADEEEFEATTFSPLNPAGAMLACLGMMLADAANEAQSGYDRLERYLKWR